MASHYKASNVPSWIVFSNSYIWLRFVHKCVVIFITNFFPRSIRYLNANSSGINYFSKIVFRLYLMFIIFTPLVKHITKLFHFQWICETVILAMKCENINFCDGYSLRFSSAKQLCFSKKIHDSTKVHFLWLFTECAD